MQTQSHLDAPVITALCVLEGHITSLKVDVLPLEESNLLPSRSCMGQAIDKGIDDSRTVGLGGRKGGHHLFVRKDHPLTFEGVPATESNLIEM